MTTLTAQEIFDKSVKGVVDQKGPAYVMKMNRAVCCYLTPEGRKCAVGQILTQNEIEEFAERAWPSIIDSNIVPERFKGHEKLIQELQKAHDESVIEYDTSNYGNGRNTISDDLSFIAKFKQHTAHIAAQHNLTMPEFQ